MTGHLNPFDLSNCAALWILLSRCLVLLILLFLRLWITQIIKNNLAKDEKLKFMTHFPQSFLTKNWIIRQEERETERKIMQFFSVTAEELHAPTVSPLRVRLGFAFIFTKFINSTRKLNSARSPEETKLSRVERTRLGDGEWERSRLGVLVASFVYLFFFLPKRTFPAWNTETFSMAFHRSGLAFVSSRFLALQSAFLSYFFLMDQSESEPKQLPFNLLRIVLKAIKIRKQKSFAKLLFSAFHSFMNNSVGEMLGEMKILLSNSWTLPGSCNFWEKKSFVGDKNDLMRRYSASNYEKIMVQSVNLSQKCNK